MNLEIQIVLDIYKEEISKLVNENIVLKAQVKQLENNLKKQEDQMRMMEMHPQDPTNNY